jgi:cytochrome c oxidase subunit III
MIRTGSTNDEGTIAARWNDARKQTQDTKMSHAAGISGSNDLGRLAPAKVGMLAFLFSEVAFFGTLIMAYVYFLNQTTEGEPSPRQVFWLPKILTASVCLFASSATIYLAERALRQGSHRSFLTWWGLTIVLGGLFLLGTGLEWSELIGKWGLTMSRNLFGTTYFTLVGFHALHVTIGVLVMAIVFGLALRGQISALNSIGVEVVSWYWHFVDGVWVVVFTLVYVVGR